MIKKQKGFTLIELLVVIAIIGLLSSVVLASLNTAREKARIASAQATLKNIQVALEFYYDDNKQYPTGASTSLCDNGNEQELNDSVIGQYMSGSAPRDPWGSYYWIDGDYRCGDQTVGCNQNDAGLDSAVILSRGPDGGISYNNGDDIVIVTCKR